MRHGLKLGTLCDRDIGTWLVRPPPLGRLGLQRSAVLTPLISVLVDEAQYISSPIGSEHSLGYAATP